MQYAKINNGAIEFAPKNKGSICNYNQDIERMKSDGYKEFETVENLTPRKCGGWNGLTYSDILSKYPNGISEILNAIDAPIIEANSGEQSWSTDKTVATTFTSFL